MQYCARTMPVKSNDEMDDDEHSSGKNHDSLMMMSMNSSFYDSMPSCKSMGSLMRKRAQHCVRYSKETASLFVGE
jgi:hypothetical protein